MSSERATYSITLDDDPMVHRMIAKVMGINSLPYTSTAALLGRLDRYQPLVLFVDVNLAPDDCGLDGIPAFRAAWPFTPILVVTADDTDSAIGQALAAGANDFVRKPVNRAELTARVKARLAEMSVLAERDTRSCGPLRYSKSYRSLTCDDKTAYLSPTEALLFESLLEAKGMVVAKAELKRRVWGDLKVSDNALDKKLFDVRRAVKSVTDVVTVTSRYGVGVALR